MDNIHIVKKDGWKFGVIKILNFSMMDAWEIRAANEHYNEYAGGPYLSEQEAIDDLHSAMERFLETNNRP